MTQPMPTGEALIQNGETHHAVLRNLAPNHEATGVYLPVRIIDMGSQLTDVIASELMEAGYATEIIPFTEKATKLDTAYLKENTGALIFSGSRKSVHDEDAPHIPQDLLDGSIPSMLFCYGAQDAVHVLGGKVGKAENDGHHLGEYGQTEITVEPDAVIYGGFNKARVLMSHGDSILELPNGFRVTGHSDDVIASFENTDGTVVGTQYHPEESAEGKDMMTRFLKGAGIEPDPSYTLEKALNTYMDNEAAEIKLLLEDGINLVGFLSGGVDSRVACAEVMQVAKELGRMNQVRFYYVNSGLNRKEDDDVVAKMQAEGVPVETIDAQHEFFHGRVMVTDKGEEFLAPPLVEVTDAKLKRLIVGNHFREISDRITGENDKLVQGTNNSDVVESGGRGGAVIKPHHNIQAMEAKRREGKLVEPLAGLLKHHVRWLGQHRHRLPREFVTRQPFPGVGLVPRIVVGELVLPEAAEQERLDSLIGELTSNRINAHIVGLDTQGSKGDDASEAHMVILDGEASYDELDAISTKITNAFQGVNRVLYAPGQTIDRSKISDPRIKVDEETTAITYEMEEIHRQAMLANGLDPYLSQHFVATLRVDLNGSGKPTLASRLFITGKNADQMMIRRTSESKEDFRFGVAAMPGKQIEADGFEKYMATMQANLQHHGVIVYDLTGKPPGTTEFE